MEASHRPQHNCSLVAESSKWKHQSKSGPLVPGEWVSPIPSFKKIPLVHLQVQNLPVHLSFLRASYSPTSHHNDSKGSEAYGSLQWSETLPVPRQLVYQGPITKRGTTEHTHCGEPNPVLGVNCQSREV